MSLKSRSALASSFLRAAAARSSIALASSAVPNCWVIANATLNVRNVATAEAISVLIASARSASASDIRDAIRIPPVLPRKQCYLSRCAEQASLGISLRKARRPACYGEITGDLARDAHQELAEILPAQEADEGPWSILESLNHVFAIFDTTFPDPGRHIAHEIPITRGKVR